ncbi:hypothetical protein F5B22DRAFT_425643 [Xylaria bambusicola]|uniref:uncharacterized protein n=1 Tax=Xylaria bambusicola TaxID=326684 RepID=UPI0020077B08|nr:uncharacterized protein F5B22DRAFT_425643 [Xylaria bambusicola]KAI0508299.1 hypothetical protein F5B22DRAFT_425643 [Xylaria bambusicola]
MASLAFLAEKNISYFTIPVAFFAALWPRSQSAFKEPGKSYFDAAHPRTFASRLEKSDLDKDTVAQILRAEAATSNGLEGLPIFAAAVVAGNSAGLSPLALNALSVGYIASRIVYNYVYIFLGGNRNLAGLRTPIWFIGIGQAMALFVKAGLAKL